MTVPSFVACAPLPRSAVGHGVGLAGLAGLVAWTMIAWHYGMDGPYAGLAAVLACGLPMVLWSVLVDHVHRNPSTGIDWVMRPRALKDVLDISLVKIVGLWATWGAIAVAYCLARWYWEGSYRLVMELLGAAAPWLLGLSIPYILWLDRRLVQPRDAAYAFGQWIVGGAVGKPDRAEIANHLRAWAVKGFFLAFMLSIVPANFTTVAHWRPSDISASPVNLAGFLIAAMFLIDVAFATVGYMLTMRPLDAHIRTANPFMSAWVAALICYPPFVLMGAGGPLDYHHGTAEWSYWLSESIAAQWAFAAVLVGLTCIYAWATVAFGLRFSNLTHRGILTHGPYRWMRHPAYLSKNLFWWFSTLPFLVTNNSLTDVVRNSAMLAAVGSIYYWRAKTEEKHLSADPDYRAYSEWMAHHAPISRITARLSRRSAKAAADFQPAE
jgi:protein-S-isoprenylcysteine O-methyltransferase Ste14